MMGQAVGRGAGCWHFLVTFLCHPCVTCASYLYHTVVAVSSLVLHPRDNPCRMSVFLLCDIRISRYQESLECSATNGPPMPTKAAHLGQTTNIFSHQYSRVVTNLVLYVSTL